MTKILIGVWVHLGTSGWNDTHVQAKIVTTQPLMMLRRLRQPSPSIYLQADGSNELPAKDDVLSGGYGVVGAAWTRSRSARVGMRAVYAMAVRKERGGCTALSVPDKPRDTMYTREPGGSARRTR
jgi:hypothetical protein